MRDNRNKQLPPHLLVPASVTSILFVILLVTKDSIPVFFFAFGIIGVVISSCYIVMVTTKKWEEDNKRNNIPPAPATKPEQHFNFSVQDSFVLPEPPKSEDTPEHKWSWATGPCPVALILSLNKITPFAIAYFSDKKINSLLSAIEFGAESYFKVNKSRPIKMTDFGQSLIARTKLDEIDKNVTCYLWQFFCEVFYLVQSDERFQKLIREAKCEGTGPVRQFLGILKLSIKFLGASSSNDSNESPGLQLIRGMAHSMEAMSTGGCDADELPNGQGEFGYSILNPIPTKTILGSVFYLERLRAPDGAKVNNERQGSSIAEVSPHPIDKYIIKHPNGAVLATLYLSPYHKRTSGKAPRGFTLGENS